MIVVMTAAPEKRDVEARNPLAVAVRGSSLLPISSRVPPSPAQRRQPRESAFVYHHPTSLSPSPSYPASSLRLSSHSISHLRLQEP